MNNDCYLEIMPASGGKDSQSCAEMLMKMYLKFFDRKRYEYRILGESYTEHGLRSISLYLLNAFSLLQDEHGTHRIIRLSPFDSANRRHTSFVNIYVYQPVNLECKNLDPKDLLISTFKSSGPGGQHANKTDSAVRIVHVPTGLKAESQSSKLQSQNKTNALEQLTARVHQQKQAEKAQQISQMKQDVYQSPSWGSFMRSYILDRNEVIDHRTKRQFSNCTSMINKGKIEKLLRNK